MNEKLTQTRKIITEYWICNGERKVQVNLEGCVSATLYKSEVFVERQNFKTYQEADRWACRLLFGVNRREGSLASTILKALVKPLTASQLLAVVGKSITSAQAKRAYDRLARAKAKLRRGLLKRPAKNPLAVAKRDIVSNELGRLRISGEIRKRDDGCWEKIV